MTLCTGAGKTPIAFQIAWRLWSSGWNRRGDHLKPKILFLADRNVLVDDPMARDFAPFGKGRFKIEGGRVSLGRDIYFAIYQAIAQDERRPGLYREFLDPIARASFGPKAWADQAWDAFGVETHVCAIPDAHRAALIAAQAAQDLRADG